MKNSASQVQKIPDTDTGRIATQVTGSILGIPINIVTYEDVTGMVLNWISQVKGCSIYTANVHMIMEAYDSPAFREALFAADLVTPDGMPLVWSLRIKGYSGHERVYGPTLMLKLLDLAEKNMLPVGFLGGNQSAIEKIREKVRERFPGIDISYAFAPPFDEFTDSENDSIVEEIEKSGVKILFVGLGCPKQEAWIYQNKSRINAVMVGIGAAFDYLAEEKKQAPPWIQKIGMEWFFRFMSEPKRLWKRYLYHNPRFIVLIMRELLQVSLKKK